MNYSGAIKVNTGQEASHLRLPVMLHEPSVIDHLTTQNCMPQTQVQASQTLTGAFQKRVISAQFKNMQLTSDTKRINRTSFRLRIDNNMPNRELWFDMIKHKVMTDFNPDYFVLAMFEMSQALATTSREEAGLIVNEKPSLTLLVHIPGTAEPVARLLAPTRRLQTVANSIGTMGDDWTFTWELRMPPLTAIVFKGDVSLLAAMEVPMTVRDGSFALFDPEVDEYADSNICLENLSGKVQYYGSIGKIPITATVYDMAMAQLMRMEDTVHQANVWNDPDFAIAVLEDLHELTDKSDFELYRIYPASFITPPMDFLWKTEDGVRPVVDALNDLTQDSAEDHLNIPRGTFEFNTRRGVDNKDKIFWIPNPSKAKIPHIDDEAAREHVYANYKPIMVSIVDVDANTLLTLPALNNASIPLTWVVPGTNLSLGRELQLRDNFIKQHEKEIALNRAIKLPDNLHADYHIQVLVNNQSTDLFYASALQDPFSPAELLNSGGVWPKEKKIRSTNISLNALPTVIDITLLDVETGLPLTFRSNQLLRYQLLLDLINRRC